MNYVEIAISAYYCVINNYANESIVTICVQYTARLYAFFKPLQYPVLYKPVQNVVLVYVLYRLSYLTKNLENFFLFQRFVTLSQILCKSPYKHTHKHTHKILYAIIVMST